MTEDYRAGQGDWIWDDLRSRPGLLREGEAVVTIPPDLLPGDYYLGVMVDSEKVIAEENEANNILFASKR